MFYIHSLICNWRFEFPWPILLPPSCASTQLGQALPGLVRGHRAGTLKVLSWDIPLCFKQASLKTYLYNCPVPPKWPGSGRLRWSRDFEADRDTSLYLRRWCFDCARGSYTLCVRKKLMQQISCGTWIPHLW